MNIDSNNEAASGTAVSIFGQAQGMNDFPVLKAFQEYIDAEQAKARKRMLGLSIFFVVLLAIVVVTFTLIVLGVINRNQTLSDRLLEFALQKQQSAVQQPVQLQPVAQPAISVPQPSPAAPVVQPAQPDLKPVLDKIERLASVIENQPRQIQPVVQPVVQPVMQQPMQAVPAAHAQTLPQAAEEKAKAEAEKIREQIKREREALAAERKKLKDEQHKAEVERNRRKMYPSYYEGKDAEAAAGKSPSQPSSKKSRLDAIKPVAYFNRQDADEDAELAELARQAARRKAVAEAARNKAEAEAAEAATRKAKSEAARRRAEAEAAEAEHRKAVAEAARRKVEADAAEVRRRQTEAAEAKRRQEEAAAAAEAKRVKEEAEKAAAAKAKEKQEQSRVKTETINVGSRDNAVPWIIQRLEEQ